MSIFKSKRHYITIIILVLVIIIATAVAAAQNASAKLVFSGVKITASGDTVQGFLDFKVKNIENMGVSFTLEYNTDYVQISNVADNTPITERTTFNNTYPFLKLNENVLKSDYCYINGEQDPTAGKYGKVSVNLYVLNNAPVGENIGEKTVSNEGAFEQIKVIKADSRELLLGSLSFSIKDPAVFARLSSEELSKVFRVETTESGSSSFTISFADMSSYPPLVFYDQSQYLDYEFQIENPIKSVAVANDGAQVSAAEIYKNGEESDLLAYLNAYLHDVTITYTDGTVVTDSVTWGEADKDYTCSADWDPKGGTYRVSQKYNDEITISATLTVTPVTLLGYTCDDQIVGYASAAAAPSSLADEAMRFPKRAKPYFDVVVPGKTDLVVGVQNDWAQSDGPAASDFFTSPQDGTYTFSASAEENDLPLWVTDPGNIKVEVKRTIGPVTPEPETLTANTDDNGVLTINVGSVGSLNPLPDELDFIVRMPNGEVIDADEIVSLGGEFSINRNAPGDGQAIIRIKAGDRSEPSQERLGKYINLGSRGGAFSIAAKNGDLPQSDFVDFTSNPRNNRYTGSGYVFDYSGSRASLFPFDESMTTLPNRITLAEGDVVRTLYSGYDGAEPGAIRTIEVENWTTGDTISSGNIVEFTGVLKEIEYTNYGMVRNLEQIEVTIRLLVGEELQEEEQIADIEDFVFNKKQAGYTTGNVQSQDFTIENIGRIDIYGLAVSIDSDDFRLIGTPPYLLPQGGASSVCISPKTGLAPGKYSATVTVSSNRTAQLDTFRISFEVTDKPVYQLTVSVNDANAGKAVAQDGYAYAAGDTVTLIATPNADYTFEEWVFVTGYGNDLQPSADSETVTFTMPDLAGASIDTVSVRADFAGTAASKLKLSELKILETDDTENDLLDENYKKIAFDPLTREYIVAVGNASEKNKAFFRLGTDEPENITVSAQIQRGSAAAEALTVNEKSGDPGAYEIDAFDLETAPSANVLTITLTTEGVSREYKITIYRKLALDKMAQFGYGNSPYGLIMRDTSVADGDKESWKAAFDEKNCFKDGYTPAGGITGLRYHPDAWGADSTAYNYDKDDSALFAYCGETFRDPGILSLTDSIGAEVDPDTVKRKVTLMLLADSPGAQLANDLSSVTETTYQLGSDFTVDETILQGRVRPGVYAIEYTFRDYDGNQTTLTRPLIVLYARGDVNLSKSVDAADAQMVTNRYRTKLPYGNLPGYEAGSRLCLYRICDANVDRNINAGDYNYIIKNGGSAPRFYGN